MLFCFVFKCGLFWGVFVFCFVLGGLFVCFVMKTGEPEFRSPAPAGHGILSTWKAETGRSLGLAGQPV